MMYSGPFACKMLRNRRERFMRARRSWWGNAAYDRPALDHPLTRASLQTLLWGLVALSVAINLAGAFLADAGVPAIMALVMTLPLAAFAVVHGSAMYGPRTMVMFAAICLTVTYLIEHAGVATGIPFGDYSYSDMLGPKLFLVPIVVGPAYVGMGYLSWMMACALLGPPPQRPGSHRMFATPLIGSFALAAWNLSYDPLISTVRGGWIWNEGGAYFGVPVLNFVGWFLTAYAFFQLFALCLRNKADGVASLSIPRSRAYWLQPVVLYASIPCIIVLSALTTTSAEFVSDPAGVVWRIRDIYAVCALVSVFSMGALAVLALIRVADMRAIDAFPAPDRK
jgi:uncharacterized membrane protein